MEPTDYPDFTPCMIDRRTLDGDLGHVKIDGVTYWLCDVDLYDPDKGVVWELEGERSAETFRNPEDAIDALVKGEVSW